jgi:transposase
MGEKRRQFTAEFKMQAVRLVEDSGKLPHLIARDLGVPVNVLRRWRAEVRRQDAAADGAGAAALSPVDVLGRLRGENAILLEEREILKKAAAFFAKDAR